MRPLIRLPLRLQADSAPDSYEGWAHSGLAYQPKGVYTPLPTVEGCILDALEKARLIEPISESDGFGCGFERCGRTDAGVSSSAQVINLWLRSDLEDPMKLNGREIDPDSPEGQRFARSQSPSRPRSSSSASSSSSDSVYGSAGKRKAPSDVEIPYVTLLNKHLPPSIRMHAWSPVSATFSSRYSCIWRHYKYFFSTSPISPLLASRFDFGAAYVAAGALPEHAAEWQERLRRVDWNGLQLDVDLMRDAVKRLVGEHDFRNLCKIDPPKQLKLHIRTVNSASIDPLEGEGGDMFVLNLRGGAFVSISSLAHIPRLFLILKTSIAALQPGPTYRRHPLPCRRPARTPFPRRQAPLDVRSDSPYSLAERPSARRTRTRDSRPKAVVPDGRRPPAHPLAVRIQFDRV